MAELEVCRGNPDAADGYLRLGMTIATVSPMASSLWGRLYATAALIALKRDDASSAVRPTAAEAYAMVGDAEHARLHAEVAATVATSFRSSAWRAMAEAARASAAQATGAADEAAKRFRSAAGLYQQGGQPYWADRSRRRAETLAGNAPGTPRS